MDSRIDSNKRTSTFTMYFLFSIHKSWEVVCNCIFCYNISQLPFRTTIVLQQLENLDDPEKIRRPGRTQILRCIIDSKNDIGEYTSFISHWPNICLNDLLVRLLYSRRSWLTVRERNTRERNKWGIISVPLLPSLFVRLTLDHPSRTRLESLLFPLFWNFFK